MIIITTNPDLYIKNSFIDEFGKVIKSEKEDIEFVVSRGLFSGTFATTFSPNTAMTRGMFVTVLGRLANADVSSYTKSRFADMKSDAYYMAYIEWASKNNIVNGVSITLLSVIFQPINTVQ